MSYLRHFNPACLLGDRLELSIYGLFVEEYLAGRLNHAVTIYKKVMKHFPEEAAVHTQENFISLIECIRANGFSQYNPVFANPDELTLLDGSHRCAIAIQLGVHSVPFARRFIDDQVSDARFLAILGEEDYAIVKEKQSAYIDNCDPLMSLKCRIRSHMRANVSSFNSPFSSPTAIPALRCYQAMESLGIRGKRLSEKRVRLYGLDRFVSSTTRLLDVGCNVGFFSMTLAKLVGQVDAFDPDQAYIDLANMVREFSSINNCRFSVATVQTFRPESKYDLLVTSAIHGWSGMPFEVYVATIAEWVEPNGLIFIESHELDAERDWRTKKTWLGSHFDIVHDGFIDDVDDLVYQSEFREFLILRKRRGHDYSQLRYDRPISSQQLTQPPLPIELNQSDMRLVRGALNTAVRRVLRLCPTRITDAIRSQFGARV